MRITREALLKLARDRAELLARQDRSLICIYLTGSLLHESPLLGGTTDIDLICVHSDEPPQPRVVTRISNEVHIDEAHYSQSVFHQPRRLRLDPWVGTYLIHNPLPLYDVQHWFEFTQATVSDKFYTPEMVIQRVRPLAEAARSAWVGLVNDPPASRTEQTWTFLKALENAGNALAVLQGPPLTERRFFLELPDRAQMIDRPGLAAGLADLFLADLPAGSWESWLPAWEAALASAASLPGCPARLSTPRRAYFTRAVAAMQADEPAAALWILLRTWTQAAALLQPGQPGMLEPWESALQTLHLGANALATRLDALDAWLDSLEELLDNWAQKYGV